MSNYPQVASNIDVIIISEKVEYVSVVNEKTFNEQANIGTFTFCYRVIGPEPAYENGRVIPYYYHNIMIIELLPNSETRYHMILGRIMRHGGYWEEGKSTKIESFYFENLKIEGRTVKCNRAWGGPLVYDLDNPTAIFSW